MDSIVIDNTDIEDVLEDVIIEELVYTDDSRLKLAREQVEQEIGNLLPPKLFKNTLLFSDMFYEPSHKIFPLKTLIPIVEANKLMLADKFKPVNNYVIDCELDPPNCIKGQLFEDFINVYSKHNTDRDNIYLHTERALYNHQRGWEFINNAGVKSIPDSTDAAWHHKPSEVVRLIPKVEIDVGHRPDFIDAEYLKENKCPTGRKYIERSQIETVYAGDMPRIVGYRNIVNYVKTPLIFDYNLYQSALKELKPNTKVHVMFNTIVYDYRNNIIDEVTGVVDSNDGKLIYIKLDKNIQLEDFMLKELECPIGKYVPFNVYTASFEPKFSKKRLQDTNYNFINLKKTEFVYPTSFAEVYCSSRIKLDLINTDNEFYPMLKNIIPELPKASTFVQPTQNYVYKSTTDLYNFIKYQQRLQYYTTSYEFYNKSIDNDVSRALYLQKKPDMGLLYYLADNKKVDEQKVLDDIQHLRNSLNEINFANNFYKKPPQIVKRYKSLIKLESDNDKDILYVDEKFDKTKYNMKTQSGLNGTELRTYLMRELDGDEFEVDATINGKRPVRIGDMALVGSSTYKWALVQKKHMWVKTTGVISVCESKIPDFEDIVDDKSMVLDTFDNLCKKASEIKKNHRYQQISEAILMLENMLQKHDNTDYIDRLIMLVQSQENIYESRLIVNSMFGYVDKIAYDEYVGEEDIDNLNNLFMNQNPSAAPFKGEKIEKEDNIATRSVLDIICKLLEIDTLEDEDKKYINDYLEVKYPDEVAYKQIEDKSNLYNKQIEQLLLQNKNKSPKTFKDMKMKLETKKAEKIEEIRTKTLGVHYFDKISSCVALLTLIIMIKHPSIVIQRLMPGCVKHFSYLAYPLLKDEEQTRSLIKYMACVLKTLYQPKDVRFTMFNDMADNVKALTIKVKQLVLEKYDLREMLENKEIKDEELEAETSYDVLNVFFKPCFNFAKTNYSNPVIQYMYQIHKIIKESKILRYNTVNMPLITNMCCMELLIKQSNFYDYFKTNDEFEKLSRIANKQIKLIKYYLLQPKYSIEKHKDLFGDKKLELEKVEEIKIIDKQVVEKEKHDDDWWEDYLHSKTKEEFQFILSKITMSEKIQSVLKLLINIEDINNVNTLMNIYANYLKGPFRSIWSKFAHSFKFEKKDKIDRSDPIVIMLESIYTYEGIKPILQLIVDRFDILSNEIYTQSDSLVDNIHNIQWMNRCMCKLFLEALWYSTGNINLPENGFTLIELQSQIDIRKTQYTQKIYDIIKLILEDLADYITINYFDLLELRNQVEVLREKAKQDLMAKYSADDEERNQQMILKNMGLNVMIEKALVEDVPAEAEPILPVKEPEYGTYVDVKGENDDDDADYDGYD